MVDIQFSTPHPPSIGKLFFTHGGGLDLNQQDLGLLYNSGIGASSPSTTCIGFIFAPTGTLSKED